MPDVPDPTGGGQRTRRPPRLGDSRAPATTITVLAIAAVAVIAGLLILRSVTGESTRADDEADTSSTTTTLPPVVITVGPVASSTTVAPPAAAAAAKSDATLIVVNASGVGGSATTMSAELAANGYSTSRVANATGGRLQQSVIYYIAGQPAAEAVARLLNTQIPQAQVAPMPDPPPLDRQLGDATVALLIGSDIAGQPLAALAAG